LQGGKKLDSNDAVVAAAAAKAAVIEAADAARLATAAAQASYSAYVADLREHYLSMIQSTLTGTIYEDAPLSAMGAGHYDAKLREYGGDWPSKALTMVGTLRLRNFRLMIESVVGAGVPGDIVETGVWRGGACILARAVLKAYDIKDRRVILCDSFSGLPPPNIEAFPADAGSTFHSYPELVVTEDQVKDNFRKFNLLDDQVVFVKGWFRDTMPTLATEKIAVLRLDGDMYESTIHPLTHLFDRIPVGGWIVVDDYEVVPACKTAVHDFLGARGLTPDIVPIDGVGVCFRKTA
jgi:O-methyltransferase